VVTAVKRRMRRVSAAMWLRTTVGEEEMNGPLVPLPHAEAVEAQLLGQQGVVEYLAEAFVRRLLYAGPGPGGGRSG
jgi:hypothetical protein